MKLVLWSGGADSTLALYQLLKKREEAVRVLSIAFPGVPANAEQSRARRSIKAALAKQGHRFAHATVSLTYDGIVPVKEPNGSIQAQLWISTATWFLRREEDLVLSWIAGELDNLPDAKAAFDALQRVGGKIGKLDLPLQLYQKAHVVDNLRAAGLYDLTWSCELTGGAFRSKPFMTSCGACNKCVELETAEWQLKRFPQKVLYP